jgi:hypothetical protein
VAAVAAAVASSMVATITVTSSNSLRIWRDNFILFVNLVFRFFSLLLLLLLLLLLVLKFKIIIEK